MTATIFVDTNVFVYARDASERPKQQLARDWVEQLWLERSGRTSTQVLSEYFVTVTRKLTPGLPPDEAWDDVEALFAWRPQSADVALLQRGRAVQGRFGLGWWDSLVVAAAQVQGCRVLLTEDLQDGADYGGVSVRNPFRLSAADVAAAYPASPRSRAHPTRGRPRKHGGVGL
jgi:predicted nucleic acid-binding protein